MTSTYFESDPPVNYLVGTPKGRLTQLEAALAHQRWQQGTLGQDQGGAEEVT